MKKFFASLILTTLFFVVQINATVFTVSNSSFVTAQFSNFADAQNAASAGDTIYLMPSAINYGDLSISKKLIIIGYSGNGSNFQPYFTQVGNIYSSSNGAATGSTFEALHLNYGIINCSRCNYITIKHCYFTNSSIYLQIDGSNYLILNCFFDFGLTYCYRCAPLVINIDCNNNSNIIFTNCIFQTNGNKYSISKSNQSSVIITHNLFLGSDKGTGAFSDFNNAIISSNIFYGTGPGGLSGCNLNNNLTYSTSQDTIPYGSNNGENNIINQDPLFVNVTTGYFTFSQNFNYDLQNGSPAKNAGTDGTDIGITGGQYPWPKMSDGKLDYRFTSNIPHIVTMNAINNIINAGSNLQVRIKATK